MAEQTRKKNTFKVTAGEKKEDMRVKGDRLIERRRGRRPRSWKVLMRTAKKVFIGSPGRGCTTNMLANKMEL